MPGAEYYRKQAQICASLALASRDPSVIARYNTMALEHLARAAKVDNGAGEMSVRSFLTAKTQRHKPRLSARFDP